MYVKFVKRIMDLILAVLALILLAPVFLLLCVAIKMDSILFWSRPIF